MGLPESIVGRTRETPAYPTLTAQTTENRQRMLKEDGRKRNNIRNHEVRHVHGKIVVIRGVEEELVVKARSDEHPRALRRYPQRHDPVHHGREQERTPLLDGSELHGECGHDEEGPGHRSGKP